MAQQTWSEAEQAPIRARLEAVSAPASDAFFKALLGTTPTLIIIDEIAQYLSRLVPSGSRFPPSGRPAKRGVFDVFGHLCRGSLPYRCGAQFGLRDQCVGDYNALLRFFQDTHGLGSAEAEAIVADTQQGVREVANRSAEAVTPVQEGDLSKIMVKLFIEPAAAEEMADFFIATSRQVGSDLSAGAHDPALRERLITHYLFYPTLIECLAEDLA